MTTDTLLATITKSLTDRFAGVIESSCRVRSSGKTTKSAW